MTVLGMRLCDAPESIRHLCSTLSCMFSDVYKGGDESSLSSTIGPKMIVGFSSWRFTQSVEWEDGLDCNSLERDFLNSSCLNSSERGTRILIF
jgi:hypothetical protein